jgi:hypothetical protein
LSLSDITPRVTQRLWYQEIKKFLLSIRFIQSTTDPNLYIQPQVLLLLYVDDILIAHINAKSRSPAGLRVKECLKKRFKMKDLGRVHRFLGIEVDDEYSISQKDYIQGMLRRFGMENAKPSSSPMDPNVHLDNPICEDQAADKKLYQSIVGSLMYASLGTRPDIAYCVTTLSRYNAAPLTMYLTAAKRALRYLKKTIDYTLNHRSNFEQDTQPTDLRLYGFTDSDWAGNHSTRKSVGLCLFSLGNHTAHILWHSKTESVVALSTLEAEYIACLNATREAIWIRRLAQDFASENKGLSSGSESPVKVGCDNQGALKLLDTGVVQAKTKHIDVKFHHTRNEIQKGSVEFYYVPSAENQANILTKPLHAGKHAYLTEMLHLSSSEKR